MYRLHRLFLVFLLLLTVAAPSAAQTSGWCGYALLEGLPMLDHQLGVLAAITPSRSRDSKPNELFQYRWNLARTAVIVEGCWRVEPTRDVLIALLVQAFPYDEKMLDGIEIGDLVKPGEDIYAADVIREYIDKLLTYSIFAPGGTADQSAAGVRDYLSANIRAWELPDQEVVCDTRGC